MDAFPLTVNTFLIQCKKASRPAEGMIPHRDPGVVNRSVIRLKNGEARAASPRTVRSPAAGPGSLRGTWRGCPQTPHLRGDPVPRLVPAGAVSRGQGRSVIFKQVSGEVTSPHHCGRHQPGHPDRCGENSCRPRPQAAAPIPLLRLFLLPAFDSAFHFERYHGRPPRPAAKKA